MMGTLRRLSIVLGSAAAIGFSSSSLVGYGESPRGAVGAFDGDGSVRPSGVVHNGTLYSMLIVDATGRFAMPVVAPGPEYDRAMPNWLDSETPSSQRVARLNALDGAARRSFVVPYTPPASGER